LSDIISLPPEQIEAAIARIKAEKERRLAEKIDAGEVINMPIFIVAGSESEARTKVEQAKADKLAELRAAGDQREVVFTIELVVTGVVRPGETADPASVPSAPTFSSREDAAIRPPMMSALPTPPHAPDEVVEEEAREELQPPVIETYICVQIRQCQDDDDPGEIAEGWFSVDAGQVTVTDANGRHVGSRAMLEGENPRVVAKRLLREKTPEAESFNRPLIYPGAGLA
jgi:hypothetical protein